MFFQERWINFLGGIIAPILPDSNGLLQPFTRPDLGFEIDPGRLRKYGKRFFKITETRLKFKIIGEKDLKEALALPLVDWFLYLLLGVGFSEYLPGLILLATPTVRCALDNNQSQRKI